MRRFWHDRSPGCLGIFLWPFTFAFGGGWREHWDRFRGRGGFHGGFHGRGGGHRR